VEALWAFIQAAMTDPEHHQGVWMMVGALAGTASALIILVAAIVAWFQLHEAQTLRENQTRPFVVIEFNPHSDSFINLRISNLGATMARNVRFSIDPPLATTRRAEHDVMAMQLFKSGIRSLVPGRVIEFFFDSWIGRDGMTNIHTVEVTYTGERGKRYRDVLDLDLDMYLGMRFIRRHTIHDVHKQLENIASILEDFKASGGGVLTMTPEAVDKRDEERQQAVEEWQRQRAASPTPYAAGEDAVKPEGDASA
jgi:hypothetical protein